MHLTAAQYRATAINSDYEEYLDRLIDGLHGVVADSAESGDEDMAATVRHACQAIIALRHQRDRVLAILTESATEAPNG